MGLRTFFLRPHFNTPGLPPEYKMLPYLLREFEVRYSNQAWSTDITYTVVDGHRAFVIGIEDWFRREVMAYSEVNTMDAFHCGDMLKMAVERFGKPEIFNLDQGSQFTSSEFDGELRNYGVKISMDGRSRCLGNAKMERF